MIAKTAVFALVALVVLYGLFEARPLLTGPTLSISSPTDGEAFLDGVVHVSGRVLHTVAFTLDGNPVLPDQQGNFSATLVFPHGTSILTFVGTSRFGRSITQARTITVP